MQTSTFSNMCHTMENEKATHVSVSIRHCNPNRARSSTSRVLQLVRPIVMHARSSCRTREVLLRALFDSSVLRRCVTLWQ